jgi:hypothetical protein
VKTTGKRASVVRVVMFCLRSGLKSEWIDTYLRKNTDGLRSDWSTSLINCWRSCGELDTSL